MPIRNSMKQLTAVLTISTIGAALAGSSPPSILVQKAFAQEEKEEKETTKKQSFKASITERVQNVIAKQLKKDVSEITPASNFIKDLGCDSLDCVELVMALEQEFQIDIPDTDANKLVTVKTTTAYVRSAIEKKASGKTKKEKD